MIITELIAKLERAREKYGDLPVFGAWEGQVSEEISVRHYGGMPSSYACKIGERILIDADDGQDGEEIA